MAKRTKEPPVEALTRRIMQNVRGRDTVPELAVRRWLHARGLRFRLHRTDLPGKPDIVLPGRRVAIFVHGCFWHRHRGCKRATTPKTRRAFWSKKFQENVARDARNERALRRLGWRVLIIWECETRTETEIKRTLAAKSKRSGIEDL
jgi:DNA mismatch endonuclease (patch repair protein)